MFFWWFATVGTVNKKVIWMSNIDFSKIFPPSIVTGFCSALPLITQCLRAKLAWFEIQELLRSLLSTFFLNIFGVSFDMLGCKYICASSQHKSHQPTSTTEPFLHLQPNLPVGFPLLSQEEPYFFGHLHYQWAVRPLVGLRYLFWPQRTIYDQEEPLQHGFSAGCMWYGTFIGNRKKRPFIGNWANCRESCSSQNISQRSPLLGDLW